MSEGAAGTSSGRPPSAAAPGAAGRRQWFPLRGEISRPLAAVCGLLCLAAVLALWHWLTVGEREERILSPSMLPSLRETFDSFPSLWVDRELSRNTIVSLRRVVLGFALAVAVGVPLGVLCGCFPPLNSLLAPLLIFGRNVPIAALVPLTYALFGIAERQKIMFIFFASVAFVMGDTARAVGDVSNRYIDTAYTLGANRWQIISRVLFPLALPSIFNSLRLLFGLAFGYIMLAETVKLGSEAGGLGDIINVSGRRGMMEHIYLVLLTIPLVALAIDRLVFWIQRELFPHVYGGRGLLRRCVRGSLHAWEDLFGLVIRPKPYAQVVSYPEPDSGPPRSTTPAGGGPP